MSETIGAVAVGVGLLFDLVGCIGLLRFPVEDGLVHAVGSWLDAQR